MLQPNFRRKRPCDRNSDNRTPARSVGYSANRYRHSSIIQNMQFHLHPSSSQGYGGQYRVYPIGTQPPQNSVSAPPRQILHAVNQPSHPQYNYPQENEYPAPNFPPFDYIPHPLNDFAFQPNIVTQPPQNSASAPPRQITRAVNQPSRPQLNYFQQNEYLPPNVPPLHYTPPVFAPLQPIMFSPVYPQQNFCLPPSHQLAPRGFVPSPYVDYDPQQCEEQEHRGGYGPQYPSNIYNNNQAVPRPDDRNQISESNAGANEENQRNGVADLSEEASASNLQNNNSYYWGAGHSGYTYVDNNDKINSFACSTPIKVDADKNQTSEKAHRGHSRDTYVGNNYKINPFKCENSAIAVDVQKNKMSEGACRSAPVAVPMAEANEFQKARPSSERKRSSSLSSSTDGEEVKMQTRYDADSESTDSDDTTNETQQQPEQDANLMLIVQDEAYRERSQLSYYKKLFPIMYHNQCTTPPNFRTDYDPMPDLTKQIWEFYQSKQMTERSFNTKVNYFHKLVKIFRGNSEGYVFLLMGSTLSGLAEANSDINVNVAVLSELKGDISPQDVLKEITKNFSIISNILLKSGKVHNLHLAECPEMKLKFLLSKRREVAVELSLNNSIALQSTHMISVYAKCDWRLRPIYLFVKYWAVSESFSGRPELYLSSYAIALMVIYFLQRGIKPAVLPVLHELENVYFHKNVFKEANILKKFEWKSDNSMLLGQLVKNFFLFYKDFDFRKTVISVKTIKRVYPIVPVNCKEEYMYIEDPFTQYNVIKRSRGDIMVGIIVRSMEKMSKLIIDKVPLKKLLNIY